MTKFQHKNDQHTIPKCYLKNFSDDGKFIHRKSKESNKNLNKENTLEKPISLKSATVKDNFYTVYDSKEPMMIETLFYEKEIENHYVKLYNKLVSGDKEIIITMEERTRILMFFLSLHCRTPKQFNVFFKNIPKNHVNKLHKIKEEYKTAHIGKTLTEFIKIHEYKIFRIAKIRDNAEFLTSDNPFLIISPLGQLKNLDFREQFNYENKFLIPLDKKNCLIITEATDIKGNSVNGKLFYNEIERVDVDIVFTNIVNTYTTDNAEKMIFGSEKYLKSFFKIK